VTAAPSPSDRKNTLPHFSLVTLDGDSLGAVELELRDWAPGTVIDLGGTERQLRVLGRLTGADHEDNPEVLAILVVQEI
jgi:hypothetical protein